MGAVRRRGRWRRGRAGGSRGGIFWEQLVRIPAVVSGGGGLLKYLSRWGGGYGKGRLKEWSSPGGQLTILSAELDIKMFSLGVVGHHRRVTLAPVAH